MTSEFESVPCESPLEDELEQAGRPLTPALSPEYRGEGEEYGVTQYPACAEYGEAGLSCLTLWGHGAGMRPTLRRCRVD
jgi:hypothetical protein